MDTLTRLTARHLLLLVTAVSLVLFTACSSDDDDGDTTGGTNTGAATGSSGELADNQVLRLSMNSEPSTIDPHLADVANEVSIARQLGTGLFTYNEDLEVVPALAAEMPGDDNGGISEDGLTYTIKLRESTWSDGSPVTAEDFVYSTLRVLDPNVASPSAWVFYDIAGAAAYNEALDVDEGTPAPPASEIENLRSQVGIRAEDDHTLVYTLEAPNPAFLNVLAHVTAVPVKAGVVEEHGDAWTNAGNYVGNGPFVLETWDRGSRLVLSRNDNWYGDRPTLDTIQVSFSGDDVTAYAAFVNGELDSARATAAALAGGENADQLVTTPRLETYALFMNNAAEPFNDPLVRQAFGSAIDREAYVNAVLQGAGAPTTSWVPPGMPGYGDGAGSNMDFDIENAQELLSDAGFDGGEGLREIALIMIASDRNELVAQFLEEQLERHLNVEVTAEFFDQGQYFDELFAGNFDITIQSWIADWPAPDNFLGLFHSANSNNFVAYANPDYDDLLDEAALEADPDAREELYLDAQEILLGEGGIAPLYNEISNTFVKPNIRDLIITGLDGALLGDLFFWKTQILAN